MANHSLFLSISFDGIPWHSASAILSPRYSLLTPSVSLHLFQFAFMIVCFWVQGTAGLPSPAAGSGGLQHLVENRCRARDSGAACPVKTSGIYLWVPDPSCEAKHMEGRSILPATIPITNGAQAGAPPREGIWGTSRGGTRHGNQGREWSQVRPW